MGITDFAQNHLGDIVHIEMPKLNASVKKGKMIVLKQMLTSRADWKA